jgi:predicted DNA-binding protein (MmcQ/YjbR family)
MNVEELRDFALSLNGVSEHFPFDEVTLVFKVKGKMFLLVSLDSIPAQFNVKCDPEKAINLRDEYPDSILPGYHMNKKHWNTIIIDGSLTSKQIKEMILDSYDIVNG